MLHDLNFPIPLILGVVIAMAAGFLIGCLFMGSSDADTIFDSDSAAPDPWDMQRAIMAASNQELPDHPTLTRTSLLYGALNMEELGETLEALAGAMNAIPQDNADSQQRRHITVLKESFLDHAHRLQLAARVMRTRISAIGDFELLLTEAEAIPLLDGVTDLVVVTAGLANSTGLPGAHAYEEVGLSNLSKRNPDTGLIDKTPDGKWIKGAMYRAPDLSRVLRYYA